ncbi:MAG: HAD-IC family P-type ATPase [Clostridia bacterium]|nr:HAD-IC family P-type ATPase [Clostridia bacterium]
MKKRLRRHAPRHLEMPDALPEDYTETPLCGLSEEEASRRDREGLCNHTRDASVRPVYLIVFSHLFTFFNLLNLALALCLVAVGSYRNMLFVGVVFCNTLIGTIQELRARRTIRRLKLMTPDLLRTLRDGEEVLLPSDTLVQGDLVILPRGSQVPADAIVRLGNGAADESMLTGESLPIHKHPGDWVLSGTFVTEGEMTVQLVYTGENSYVASLTREARKVRHPKSALMTDLSRLTQHISFALIPLGLLLFCKQYFYQHRALERAVPQAVASMVGMIPEGLILLTSVALCVGVVRLGRRGALVQELYGIETLSRADVLCLDKTGTLTTGGMTMHSLIPAHGDEAALRAALAHLLAAFPEDGTPTFSALRHGITPADTHPIATLPFSSERKCSCAWFEDTVYLFGAPSFVLREHYTGEIETLCEHYTDQGFRVLLLATGKEGNTDVLPEADKPLGLVLLTDTVRPDARETLAYFREEGVDIRILSGDDPRTVAAVARSVGLSGTDRFVDTALLSDAELQAASKDTVIFGRVTPERKKELVLALQEAGHHVAMTGDGVNDIPALKAADCSIAMASGSEAARNAAQITLVSSDFSLLPEVVLEGRRVVNNVTRSASLFLVKTLYSLFLTLLLLFLPATYPFQPVQLTAISSFTVGIPAFFLSLESNRERIRGGFLRTVLRNAMPGAVCVTLCACFSMIMENFGWSVELGSTIATLCAGGIGLMSLYFISRPLNLYRRTILLAMTLLLLAVFLFAGKIIYFTPPSLPNLMVFFGLMVFSFVLMLCMFRRLEREAQ